MEKEKSVCKGITCSGQPCRNSATINGYCVTHFHKIHNKNKRKTKWERLHQE